MTDDEKIQKEDFLDPNFSPELELTLTSDEDHARISPVIFPIFSNFKTVKYDFSYSYFLE